MTTASITYDDVIKLYFSVKNEYRKNAVWMMNDRTALTLRTLKDANGNYIWNHSNDTTSQMEWVQRCNNIRNRAEEIVLHEMSYS